MVQPTRARKNAGHAAPHHDDNYPGDPPNTDVFRGRRSR
jgi:hypothetical protein